MAGLFFMNDFNFEIERQRLIENLDFHKSLSVEESTFYKKWDELRHHIEPERHYIHTAGKRMWRPKLSDYVPDAPEAENRSHSGQVEAVTSQDIIIRIMLFIISLQRFLDLIQCSPLEKEHW